MICFHSDFIISVLSPLIGECNLGNGRVAGKIIITGITGLLGPMVRAFAGQVRSPGDEGHGGMTN